MTDTMLNAFGVTEADLLGDGWESTIYALGATQVLRIPRPGVGSEAQVRAQAALTANLPALPCAVPRITEIGRIDGQLYVIEDRIAGQSMASLLPSLSGERRATALRAYLAAAEAMAAVIAPGEAFGDLLLDHPRRCDRWSDYLTARVTTAAKDEVLAMAVPGLAGIVERFNAGLRAIPEPARCIVLNRPGFTGGQNSRRIARYGTDTNEEDHEAVFPRVPRTCGSVGDGTPRQLSERSCGADGDCG